MDDAVTMQRLLALRKLTRKLDDVLRPETREVVTTLAPVLRPRAVFGDFVQGAGKETVRGAEQAWRELETTYAAVAGKPPFSLIRELKPPIDIPGTSLDLTPVQYGHVADGKRVVVTKPFEWVVSYSSYGPQRLRELLADKNRNPEELQRAVVLAIVIHIVFARQPGAAKVLAGLRLPVEARRMGEFGELPVTVLASAVRTMRPSDALVVESTEMTGTDSFQEVVDVAALQGLQDPYRDRLFAVLREEGELA